MAIQSNTQVDTPRSRGDYDAPHISPVTPAEDLRTVMLNRISWGAVFAGVAVALSVQIILSLIGIGFGAAANGAVISTSYETGTLSLGAMLWLAVCGVIAALAGGYAAGRLCGEPKESTAGWHGFISWAASVVVVAILMSTAVGTLLGGDLRAIADVAARSTAENAAVSGPVRTATVPTTAPGSTLPATTAGTTGYAAGNTATADTDTGLAGGALFSALVLILCAFAAWCGGWMGTIDPTITERDLLRQSLH